MKIGRFTVAVVPVTSLDFLDKNARYMKNETFRRLVENVKADGQLSQFPFCLKVGDRYRVLSGNHRGKAAIVAGLEEIPIIYTEEALTRQEQVAVQLSHNAISGEDDTTILKELYAELADVSAKLYSGLDDKALGLLADVQLTALADVRLDFRTINFLFLPEEPAEVKDAFNAATAALKAEEVYLLRLQSFDGLLDALAKTSSAYNIVNAATALLAFLALYRRHMTDLEEGWYDPVTDAAKHKGWVPLASIFNADTIPADAAVVVRRALQVMMKRKDVDPKSRWLALEYWAASYLAGPDDSNDEAPPMNG